MAKSAHVIGWLQVAFDVSRARNNLLTRILHEAQNVPKIESACSNQLIAIDLLNSSFNNHSYEVNLMKSCIKN